jgi:beta-alanine degradation protein BauB
MIAAPADWPVWRKEELYRNERNGQVGNHLVSENDEVRVWLIDLKPGERLPLHAHVLNYFWTATSAGRARSHFPDGHIAETAYKIGETKHYRFAAGEQMIHDLENVGPDPLTFTTVELKIGSANAPLTLPMIKSKL